MSSKRDVLIEQRQSKDKQNKVEQSGTRGEHNKSRTRCEVAETDSVSLCLCVSVCLSSQLLAHAPDRKEHCERHRREHGGSRCRCAHNHRRLPAKRISGRALQLPETRPRPTHQTGGWISPLFPRLPSGPNYTEHRAR